MDIASIRAGQTVYGFGQQSKKFVAVKVIKTFKKNVRVENERGQTMLVSPEILTEKPEFPPAPETFPEKSDEDLDRIAGSVKKEFARVFSTFTLAQQRIVHHARARWGRQTVSTGGSCKVTTERDFVALPGKSGLTEVKKATISLCVSSSFKSAPENVIRFIVYHELLHIGFNNHGKRFRALEHEFPGWSRAIGYIREMLAYCRYAKDRMV